jgi:hypothetical protein
MIAGWYYFPQVGKGLAISNCWLLEWREKADCP